MAPPLLRRFLHLERARPEAPDGEAPLPAPERFGGKPAPAAGAAEPPLRRGELGAGNQPPLPREAGERVGVRGSSAASRFLRPDLRAPDVAPVPEGQQPFIRCMRCETDASLYAARCETCGEPLDTPAQRAFNERLWAERRREAGEEERALAEARAGREQAEAEAARARREMGELLAAETARRERDRILADEARDGFGGRWGRGGWGGWGGWGGGPGWGGTGGPGWGGGWGGPGGWEEDDPRPLGLRLLGLVKDPRWRIGIAVGVLGAALLAGLLAFRAGSFLGVYGVVAVFAVLFSPRRRRRWWR